MNLRRHLLFFTVVTGLVSLGGCGESYERPGPEPFPVHGKVLYQGEPAAGFRVTFHPLQEFEQAQFAPAAVTDPDGTFALHSYTGAEPDGAPAGEYRVTFKWPDHINELSDPEPTPEKDQLRGRYSNPENSNWKVQVVEGENELEPFELN